MAATSQFDDDLLDMKYRAHERYQFGWTDWRGMNSQPPQPPPVKIYDMSTDFLTNFMGMVIIMIPVSVVAYWLWF